MTVRQLTPTAGILMAINVARTHNEVLVEVPGQCRRRLTVLNTRPEHNRLVALLAALGQPVTCAFEPTGNYHRPLAWHLLQAGFAVHLVSSLALARTREAPHNGWDKNDPKDAQVILHILRIGAVQRYHDPLAAGIHDVQELSKTHEAVSRAKTEVLHRILTHYLPLYFPEVDRFRRNSRSDWFFAFLDRFPTPASITALSKEAFVTAAWDVVGRKVAKAQLLGDVYETARSSIGLPCRTSTGLAGRIASLKPLPDAELLPRGTCYPPRDILGRGTAWGDGSAWRRERSCSRSCVAATRARRAPRGA